MSTINHLGPKVSDIQLTAICRALRGARSPSGILDLARETGLSTLVVVPGIEELLRENRVVREVVGASGSERGRWCYHLSVEGHRSVRAAS